MRQFWGLPDGIPEGSDFRLEALLTLNGAGSSAAVTSSGTYTVTLQDSVLNAGTALLTDEASDSKSAVGSALLVAWQITDTQSSAWEAGMYEGDIKLVDSAGLINYWAVGIKTRTARD